MNKSAKSMGFIPAYGSDTSKFALTLHSAYMNYGGGNYNQKLIFDDGSEITTGCRYWTDSPVMRKYADYGVREIIKGYSNDIYKIAEIPEGLKGV